MSAEGFLFEEQDVNSTSLRLCVAVLVVAKPPSSLCYWHCAGEAGLRLGSLLRCFWASKISNFSFLRIKITQNIS